MQLAKKAEQLEKKRRLEAEEEARKVAKKKQELESKAKKATEEATKLRNENLLQRSVIERAKKESATALRRAEELQQELTSTRGTLEACKEELNNKPTKKAVVEDGSGYQSTSTGAFSQQTPLTAFNGMNPAFYGSHAITAALQPGMQYPTYPPSFHTATSYSGVPLPPTMSGAVVPLNSMAHGGGHVINQHSTMEATVPSARMSNEAKMRLLAKRKQHQEMALAMAQATVNANAQMAAVVAQVNLRHIDEEEAILG